MAKSTRGLPVMFTNSVNASGRQYGNATANNYQIGVPGITLAAVISISTSAQHS